MPNLTTDQQKALAVYKDTGEVGILENLLIEHCLDILKHSDHAQDRFNSILRLEIPKDINKSVKLNKEYQIIFIQTLLSRTLHGKAVMPFLDVPCIEYKGIQMFFNKSGDQEFAKDRLSKPQTLDHKLYREFTEALRVGNDYQEAYQIINKMYLNSL